MIQAVAIETVPESFLIDQAQGLPERIVHGNRSRVVVGAVVTPVLFNHGQIQIPALHLVFSPANPLHGPAGDRDGRQARGTAQALLGPTVGEIDPMSIDFHGMTAQ